MVLVGYSDSEPDDDQDHVSKKRKLASDAALALPALPPSFLDQYSSTVRTSSLDDPALHGGRRRVTPHVEGHWPTHVYLEWHPRKTERQILSEVLSHISDGDSAGRDGQISTDKVRTLLENDLSVPLPLHISLSRPLVLRSEQKDFFLTRLRTAVRDSGVNAFDVCPRDLAWYDNETTTRSFLVLRVRDSGFGPLQALLDVCNGIARDLQQPLLYSNPENELQCERNQFHISIAWSLPSPRHGDRQALDGAVDPLRDGLQADVPDELLGRLGSLSVAFSDVKVRIGQDVHVIPLKHRRNSQAAD